MNKVEILELFKTLKDEIDSRENGEIICEEILCEECPFVWHSTCIIDIEE